MDESAKTGEQLFREVIKVNNESDIQTRLYTILSHITGQEWLTEHNYGTGPIDLLCPAWGIVIECKKRGSVDPNLPGHKGNETQKGQLERYLSDVEKPLYKYQLVGFLTDGISWWGYNWSDYERKAIPLINYPSRKDINSYDELKDFMENIPELKQNKSSGYKVKPPENLGELLFDPLTKKITDIQRKMEQKKEFKTKLILWENVLKGSGITPPGTLKKYEVFGLHSLLVITSRLLIGILNNENDVENLLTTSGDGFQGWLLETHEGEKLIKEKLYKELLKYDWQGVTKDILKAVYHSLIDKEHRKEFGEYYTPDNLAEIVVEEVLDDDWCDNAIKRVADILDNPKEADSSHLGMLDPSCGSGTFLFHAAQRIYNRIREKHRHEFHRAAEITARLVHGIDIHPVAVEMAKATLSMALPNSRDLHLRVILADAMQSEEVGALPLDITIDPFGKKGFIFPRAIITHKKANQIIECVVSAAVREDEKKLEQVSSFVEESLIKKLYGNLVDLIRNEGNHVWNWYLLNIIASANLNRYGVDRIVGNPPWLVANDTPEGQRKAKIDRLRKEESVKPKFNSSAKGDLASVFTARVTGLYASKEGTRYGWILPGSAIIGQTWNKWQEGIWGHAKVKHEFAWSLDKIEPPVFPHSPNGTCVFIGQTTSPPPPPQKTIVQIWEGTLDAPTISEKFVRESKKSYYLDKFRRGAMSSPYALLIIINSEEKKNGLVNVQFNIGTKTPWKGLNMTATVEKDALLSIVRSQELKAFKTETNKTFFLAPLEKGKLLSPDRQKYKDNYPKTLDYWKRADKIYRCHRSSKAGETLFDNLDWKGTLSTQLEPAKKERKFKVIYNKSGNILQGAIVSGKQVVHESAYYLVTDYMEEALYLCGIINAPVMQDVWQESKTSKIAFDKSPWRHVPVPRYKPNNKEHKAIVSAAKEVEQAQNPSDKLDILNEPVQTLLQDFLFNSP